MGQKENSSEETAIKAGFLIAKQELEIKTGKAKPESGGKKIKANEEEIIKKIKQKKQSKETIEYDIFKLKKTSDYPQEIDPKSVLETVKEKLWERPKDAALINIAMAAHMKLKEYTKAEYEYKKGTIIDPKNNDLRYNIAELYFRNGSLNQSLEEVTHLLKKENNIEELYLAAEILYLQGNIEKAIDFIGMALKTDKEFKRVHKNFAFLSLLKRNKDKAEESLEKLIKEDVKNIPARIALANINLIKNDMDKYENQDKLILSLVKGQNSIYTPCIFVNKGREFVKKKMYKEAKEQFDNAKKAYPDCICATIEEAEMNIKRGEYEKNYLEIINMVRLDLRNILLLVQMLKTMYYLKKENEIKSIIQSILKIDKEITINIFNEKGTIIRLKLIDIADNFFDKMSIIMKKYEDIKPEFTLEAEEDMVIYKLYRDIEICNSHHASLLNR